MKSIKTLMMVALTIFTLSVFAQTDQKTKKPVKKDKVRVTVQYTCPMDKDVFTDKPGKCPKCGMDLVKVKQPATKTVYYCPMHSDVTSDKPGKCSKCWMDLVKAKQPAMKTVYICPMDPDVTSDKPGKCPKCGMALVKKAN